MELYTSQVAEQYEDFARYADGSPCFEEWATSVVDDPEVLAWIGTLPPVKRQPNLVFAAARWHGVPAPGPYEGLRRALLDGDGAIRGTILARRTQTNEVGRLATLVPFLGGLAPEPMSLLEVGASAGLCLYPDRFRYVWHTDTDTDQVEVGAGPELSCAVTGSLPSVRLPEVAWRGGVDLHPLDVADADAMAWLENLVWPEQEDRRERLRAAVDVARADPPRLIAGDLLDLLPDLAAKRRRTDRWWSSTAP